MTNLELFRHRHPVGFCIAAAVLSMIFVLGSGVVISALCVFVPLPHDYYVLAFLQEGLATVLIGLLLREAGCGRVLLQKGCGLWRGLAVGLYPLILIGFATVSMLAQSLGAGAALAAPVRIVAFVGTMVLIGLAEEMAFRGLIATTLLEYFGTGRVGVWKAVTLSGLLFGLAHMTNLFGAQPLGVLVQVAVTTVLGMLFAAIYYRTGNLWVVIFLHTAMDFASLCQDGLFAGSAADQGVEQLISGYTLINLAPVITYGIPLAFLLRRKKLAEMQALWTKN